MKNFIIFYVTVVCFWAGYFDAGQFSTYFLIPSTLAFLIVNFGFAKIFKYKSLVFYSLFVSIGFMFLPFSYDIELSLIAHLKTLIMYLFLITLCIILTKKPKLFLNFLKSIIILMSLVNIYAISIPDSYRLELGIFNANTYGYYYFVGTTALYIYHNLSFKKKSNYFFMIPNIIASFYILFFTISRSSIIIILAINFLYILITFFNIRRTIYSLFTVFSSVVIFTLSIYYIIDNNQNVIEDLTYRYEITTESKRIYHFNKSLEVSSNSFIVGNGANYYSYQDNYEYGSNTHNSFLEILVSYGFFGLLFYVVFTLLVFVNLIKNLFDKRIKNQYKNVVQILFVSFIFYLAYQFLYLTYLEPLFIVYLALLIIFSYNIRKNKDFKLYY